MKNIYEILRSIGIEVPEDKKAGFDKEWKENYRTKEEYDKAVTKRDEYKKSLDDVQTKLDGFKDVDVEELKRQISTLTTDLQAEKDARAADAKKAQTESSVIEFLSGKKFVNPLTERSIRQSLIEELDKDTAKGKSMDDIFKTLISDADGNPIENILVDETKAKARSKAARFTLPAGKASGSGGQMTKEQIMSIKDREERRQAMLENRQLFPGLGEE